MVKTLDTKYIIVLVITYFLLKGDGEMVGQCAAAASTQFCNASSAYVDLRIRMLSVLLSILILVLVLVHDRASITERS